MKNISNLSRINMRKHLHKYFIPDAGNNYHPYILHKKRTVLYSVLFVLIKVIALGLVLSIPDAAFVSADILSIQQDQLIRLTNELREQHSLETLSNHDKLFESSSLKATDMAQRQYFSHTSPDGKKLADFLQQVNYDYQTAGENLAMGYGDAEELFQAWLDSPTHLDNLIDSDFEQLGITVTGGLYNNIPTVYVVQHLGQEKAQPAATTNQPEINLNDVNQSYLLWSKTEKGMLITAVAHINKLFKAPEVQVKQYKIALSPQADNNTYSGSIEIDQTPENFFKIITPGVITAAAPDGRVVSSNIQWQNIELPGPTVFEKYFIAKNQLTDARPLFIALRFIYLSFILTLALILFIQIKKQHYNVMPKTLGLLVFLIALYIF